MKPKAIYIFPLVTVVVAALATIVVINRGSKPTPPTDELFPDLTDRLKNLAVIEVNAGDARVTMSMSDSGWLVDTLGGYPAKPDAVWQLQFGMSALVALEPRTSNPELYSRIGVQDPAPGPGSSTLVTLLDGAGSVLASAIVGHAQAGPPETVFIRKAGETASWLARGRISAPTDPLAWIDRSILAIDQGRLKAATIRHPTGSVVSVWRAATTDPVYRVDGVPQGRSLRFESVGNPVATAVTFMNLEAVKPAAEVDFDGAASAEYRTFDGLVIEALTVEHEGGQTWARFSASAEAAEDSADAAAAEQVAREVADLNARLAPWAFRLAPTKADQMRRTLDDMLADDPNAPPVATPEDPFGPAAEEAPFGTGR